ncbi:effector-associated domain EAD1-containing protein [Frankia sp. CIT1]|uniref:effector-associated domain EAD1-containing protein n=1 Tax=Frankia sp. CIT1 TaxID=2880974 RepID=UPI001EF67771|nr:effector-associated domain EAD1-containing protein [Frankia sp. CIT1]
MAGTTLTLRRKRDNHCDIGAVEAGGLVAPVGDADIRLSRDDRDDFREELAAVYRTESAAALVLSQIDFPLAYRPVLQGGNPEQWWSQIFFELDAGTVVDAP